MIEDDSGWQGGGNGHFWWNFSMATVVHMLSLSSIQVFDSAEEEVGKPQVLRNLFFWSL